ASQAEVSHLNVAVVRYKNIFGFNVAVDKTDSVCRCYTPDDREGDVPCFFNCHVLCRTHDFTQGMAFNELHGEEGYVASSSWAHALVVDVDHVRVIDLGSILSFCFEFFDHSWVFGHIWAQNF